ncbi:hypothetical protein [Streptomyces hiroshimensis]|uniref:Uncharacterized protein n=1 Tax=Streptomyces hiroshimensis TaxID=66424 RepID=A0ABQ2Y528_9ACTN|nr:hypothetical protein [Streptomyces hiroshimensis]GGX60191.1 hypothetical protein GCM10010324_00980 [Streptomyces hiroshimensis]
MDDKGESEAKQNGKRLELSLAQVAGSALAAVIAALLAGKLGVYGTVIGAGVVSVVATSGGTIFQHLFKRTGEQLREATTQAAAPKLRQVPVQDAGRAVGRAAAVAQDPARRAAQDDATRMLPQADPTQMLPRADATQMLPQAGDEATRLLHAASRSPEPGGVYAGAHPDARADEHSIAYTDAYTTATTHGTRTRGWKRPLIAAGAVFVLAMGAVTTVELVKGSSADGGKGTTVSQIFDGGKSQKKQDPAPERSPDPGRSHDGGGEERGTGGESGSSPGPDASRQGGDTGKQSPDPSTSPSSGGSTPSTKPDPTPNPSTSPGGGTGGDDKGGSGTSGQGGTGGGTTPKPPTQGQNAAAGAGSPAAGVVS